MPLLGKVSTDVGFPETATISVSTPQRQFLESAGAAVTDFPDTERICDYSEFSRRGRTRQ